MTENEDLSTDERPRRRRRAVPEIDQTVYPMPQSEQPHPQFGFDAPNPYAEEAK